MNKVLIPTKLSDVAANTLKTAGYEVVQDADTPLEEQAAAHPDTVALIVRSEKVTPEIMDALPSLKLVIRAGAGYDNIDIVYARKKNVDVMNTPGANSNAVAEEVMAMILAYYRHIVQADATTREGLWEKKKYMGSELTKKTVGIIGGGPGGLTAAYYLAQMGHQVTVYEQRPKLGGMLRYGIPDYRLPQEVLERDIEHILTTGINVITDVSIGRDVTMEDIQKSYDAVYISIGAHNDKKIGIEGEDAENVVSAVSLLRRIDEGNAPDFTGKRICVIGGGNVSMDATRTAKRLGAESVTCVYRRRVDDMTALAEEIEEAMAEGCQILPLQAPARIEKDAEGKVAALWTVPQIIGPYGKDGRPKPIPADVPEFRIACDYVIVAIGQAIDARPFEAIGIKTFKGMIQAEDTSSVADVDNVFAGGDAVSGPATVIRAVAAGKVAAANIDAYLGFEHKIKTDVVVPPAHLTNAPPCGRVNLKSHCTPDCKGNFDLVVEGMSRKEADQESERCLRCDYFGFGSFRGGRTGEW